MYLCEKVPYLLQLDKVLHQIHPLLPSPRPPAPPRQTLNSSADMYNIATLLSKLFFWLYFVKILFMVTGSMLIERF